MAHQCTPSGCLTGLGDYDAALDSLERACDNPDDSLLGVKVFPMLDPEVLPETMGGFYDR